MTSLLAALSGFLLLALIAVIVLWLQEKARAEGLGL